MYKTNDQTHWSSYGT